MFFSSRIILIVLAFTFSIVLLKGQETKVVSDFRLRSEIGIEKDLFDKWEVQFETIFKAEKNVSRLDEIDFDLGVSYDLLRFVSLSIGYRWELNKDNDGIYQHRHRLSGDADATLELGRYEFEWRVRYQTLDDDFISYPVTSRTENILRNRLEIEYNVPDIKLFPFISVEHYGTLNDSKEYGIKMRYMLGAGYSIGDHNDIELYYRINRELNSSLPYTFYYIGLGYRFSF